MSKKKDLSFITTEDLGYKHIEIDGEITGYRIYNTGVVTNNLRELKQETDHRGYNRVSFSVRGYTFHYLVHRLVALAFIPNPENKREVNHKNGNKSNNHVDNLEWVTRQENINHAINTGLDPTSKSIYTEDQIRNACAMMEDPKNKPFEISKATGVPPNIQRNIRWFNSHANIACDYNIPRVDFSKGSNNIKAVINEDQVKVICELLEDGNYTPKMIADKMGINANIVQHIRTGNGWRHISKNYNISDVNMIKGETHHNAKYTNDQINNVCRLLSESKLTYESIAEQTGVNKHTVSRIFEQKQWTDISKNYVFVPRNTEQRNPWTNVIIEMLRRGCANKEITDHIMLEFGLPDRRQAQLYVSDVKSRYYNNK